MHEQHDTRVDGEVKVKKRKKRKKRLFKLSAMNTLVDENSFLKNKYDKLSAGAEEKLGYHWNEVVQNILFNKFVKPDEKLMGRYLEIKRRDEADKAHKDKHHDGDGGKQHHHHDAPENAPANPEASAEVDALVAPQVMPPVVANPAGPVDTRITTESTDTFSAGNYQHVGPLVTTKGGMKAWMRHWESKIKNDKSGMTIIEPNRNQHNMGQNAFKKLNESGNPLANPSLLTILFEDFDSEQFKKAKDTDESEEDETTETEDKSETEVDHSAEPTPKPKEPKPVQGPEKAPEDGEQSGEKTPGEIEDDCRTENGVTVGLIDSLIFISRILAQRDLTDEDVVEALKDLKDDEDINSVLNSIKEVSKEFKRKRPKSVPRSEDEDDDDSTEEKESTDESEGSESSADNSEPKSETPKAPKMPKAPNLYEGAGEKKPDALVQIERLHKETEKASNGYYKKDQKERNLNMETTKDGGLEQKHDYDKDSVKPEDVKKHHPSKEEVDYVKLNRGGNLADRAIQGITQNGNKVPDAFLKRMKDEAGADVVKDAQDKAAEVAKQKPALAPPARVQTLKEGIEAMKTASADILKEGVILTARYMTPTQRSVIAFNTSLAESVTTVNPEFILLETKGFGNDSTPGAKSIIAENDFFIDLGNNQIYSRAKQAGTLNEGVVELKKSEYDRYRHLIGYSPRTYGGGRK